MCLILYDKEISKNGKDRTIYLSMFELEQRKDRVQFFYFDVDWFRSKEEGKFFAAVFEILNIRLFHLYISWGQRATEDIYGRHGSKTGTNEQGQS